MEDRHRKHKRSGEEEHGRAASMKGVKETPGRQRSTMAWYRFPVAGMGPQTGVGRRIWHAIGRLGHFTLTAKMPVDVIPIKRREGKRREVVRDSQGQAGGPGALGEVGV